MPKSVSYHTAVIEYNDVLATCAEGIADTTPDEMVKKWATGIGKSHRFHQRKHERLLERVKNADESGNDTDEQPVEAAADNVEGA